MQTRGDSARQAYPLFQTGDGGSRPTSPLQLFFSVIDLDPAKELNALWHSRFPEVDGGGARLCCAAEHEDIYYAVAIWTNPSSAKLPQLPWLMLKRWAIADDAPTNAGSRMMMWMMKTIRRRLREVRMLVSYSDPDTNDGAIYRACGWVEAETTVRSGDGWGNRKRERTENDKPTRVTRWLRQLH